MSDIRWLTRRMVEAFHRESLARFGGADGIRDEGLLESATERIVIDRPSDRLRESALNLKDGADLSAPARARNRAAYEDDPPIFALAAGYCFGILRNHPFVDGNKRAGLLSARVFLALNGWRFEPDEAVTVEMIRGLAAGEVDEEALARWLTENSVAADE